MSNAILIDIDNCWMDSRIWLSKRPANLEKQGWDLFNKRVYLCKPNKSFIKDVISLIKDSNLFPIFITARSEKIRKSTIFQIQNNSSLIVDVNCLLYMRSKDEDSIHSDTIKYNIIKNNLNNYTITYAIDDEDNNLTIYKKLGINTVIKYNIEKHDYERI